MKNTMTLIAVLLISISSFAQQGINYKALIKDNSGNVLSSQSVGVQFQIREATANGSAVYTETHPATTDANGILVLNIGTGTTSDTFSAIDWSSNEHWLNVQIDITGGTNYTDMSTTQFMAVPYALSSGNRSWEKEDDNVHVLTKNVGIGTSAPTELLHISDNDKASINLTVPQFGDESQIEFKNGIETGTHSFFKLSNVSDNFRIDLDTDLNPSSGYLPKLVISNEGLLLENGTSINEFSTDGTFAGNSNNAVPTEAAVKAYVDNSISNPETKTLMIPSVAFNSTSGSFVFRTGYAQLTSGTGALYAPLLLPNGVTITNIQAVFFDTDSSSNLTLRIIISSRLNNFYIELNSVSSSGTSSVPQIVDMPTSTINILENSQYLLEVTSSANWPTIFNYGIKMVKITYTE